MKNQLLPETDLARIALFSDERKRVELLKFKKGYSTLSYAPFRDAVPGIFNTRKSLFDDLSKCEWEQIESSIKRICRSRPDWIKPNVGLAKALYDFLEENPCDAVEKDFMPVSIGFGAKVKFWQNFYFNRNGVPTICFMDPRRTNGLTDLGRQFVFSIMHHNLALGDFADVKLQILKYPTVDDAGTERSVSVYEFDKSRLLSENEINAAINATYKIWFEVLEEREQEMRRSAAGNISGGFNF